MLTRTCMTLVCGVTRPFSCFFTILRCADSVLRTKIRVDCAVGCPCHAGLRSHFTASCPSFGPPSAGNMPNYVEKCNVNYRHQLFTYQIPDNLVYTIDRVLYRPLSPGFINKYLPRTSPCSAASRYHLTASLSSFTTPIPSS